MKRVKEDTNVVSVGTAAETLEGGGVPDLDFPLAAGKEVGAKDEHGLDVARVAAELAELHEVRVEDADDVRVPREEHAVGDLQLEHGPERDLADRLLRVEHRLLERAVHRAAVQRAPAQRERHHRGRVRAQTHVRDRALRHQRRQRHLHLLQLRPQLLDLHRLLRDVQPHRLKRALRNVRLQLHRRAHPLAPLHVVRAVHVRHSNHHQVQRFSPVLGSLGHSVSQTVRSCFVLRVFWCEVVFQRKTKENKEKKKTPTEQITTNIMGREKWMKH